MNSHFFAVIISEQLLLQSETSTEQPLLENRNLFGQLLFETATFLAEELFRKKRYIQKSYFFKAGTSAHHQIFQENYILEKGNNSEKQYSLLPTFAGELLFRAAATFSKDAMFYIILLFRRLAFLQDTFSEELIFHSYASFPQLYYLLICQ